MENHNTTPYTHEFRVEMVRRMTGPHSVTAKALARESGIAQSTLSVWLRDARSLVPVSKKERSPEEKLKLVLSGLGLEGEALGAFLRREGVHEVELRDWRKAMLSGLAGGRPPPKAMSDARRIQQLERDLRRKDKALAEAAALVILKKKAQAFGWLPKDEDSDTDEGNGSSS